MLLRRNHTDLSEISNQLKFVGIRKYSSTVSINWLTRFETKLINQSFYFANKPTAGNFNRGSKSNGSWQWAGRVLIKPNEPDSIKFTSTELTETSRRCHKFIKETRLREFDLFPALRDANDGFIGVFTTPNIWLFLLKNGSMVNKIEF